MNDEFIKIIAAILKIVSIVALVCFIGVGHGFRHRRYVYVPIIHTTY